MSDEAVCRTAPATPGLSNIITGVQNKLGQEERAEEEKHPKVDVF